MGRNERNNVPEKLFYFSDLKFPAEERSVEGPGTFFGVRNKVIKGDYFGDIIFSYKSLLPPKNFERDDLFVIEVVRPNLPTLNDFINSLEETNYSDRIVAYFDKSSYLRAGGDSAKSSSLEFIHWKSVDYERVDGIEEVESLENSRIAPLDSVEVRRSNFSHLENDLKFLEEEINDVYGLL